MTNPVLPKVRSCRVGKIAFLCFSLTFASGCAQQNATANVGASSTDASPFAFNFGGRGVVPKGAYGNVAGGSRSEGLVFDGVSPKPTAAAAADGAPVRYADASGGLLSAGNGSYRLNFEDADVGAVSKAILGDILKANYLVDKRVSGQITLTSSQPVPRSKLVPLLETALASIGAAVVKEQDLYRIVPSADPGGIGNVDTGAAGEGFGTTVIPARYMSATSLGHLLEGFGSRAGSVRADPATNLVIVQGTAAERAAAIQAANMVDVDWLRSKSVAILPVANSAPETIIGELNHILDTGEGGLSQNVVQLEPMSRLNAVLAVSRRRDGIEFVRRWVSRLDRVDVASAGVKVYRLEYAQAKTVAAAINELFGSGSSSGGPSEKDLLEPSGQGPSQTTSPAGPTANLQSSNASLQSDPGNASGGAQSPFGALKTALNGDFGKQKGPGGDPDIVNAAFSRSGSGAPKVRVTADVNSNSLLINANALDYKLVERAIRQMDRRPVQVDIEATIAEVTLTQDLQYGVQFFVHNQSASLGLSGASGVPLQPPSTSGLNLLVGAASNPKVLLDALQSFTTVKILSSPSLVVLDRQPAVLQVGDQVPILTRTAQSIDTTNAPVVNNVDYKDTGIILNVLPRVNANGVVTLDVEQQISSVSSTDPTTLTPTISQRRVRSSVAVSNGQTVMLAGLISDKQSNSRSGFPYLSSIKFLGDILSSHDTALNRTEIIIFIKPTIISNAADAQQVTEEFHDRLVTMRREAESPNSRK